MSSPRHENLARLHATHVCGDSSRSVLWLSGELDIAAVSIVRSALDNTCRDSSGEVIVDLSDVLFFDAITVGIFDQDDIRLDQTGRRLTLLGLTPHQEKVLGICELEHLLAGAVCRDGPLPSVGR